MLSISLSTVDCDSEIFQPRRFLTWRRPLLSKRYTFAIYCAMWNAWHHYWHLTACTNWGSYDTAGPTQHCTDHRVPSSMPATSGCLKWSHMDRCSSQWHTPPPPTATSCTPSPCYWPSSVWKETILLPQMYPQLFMNGIILYNKTYVCNSYCRKYVHKWS